MDLRRAKPPVVLWNQFNEPTFHLFCRKFKIYKEKSCNWHCINCGASSHNILPCPSCPDVKFCSSKCLHQALQGHHRYECTMRLYGILRAVNKNVVDGLSVGKLMALRLVTQQPPSFFMNLKDEFNRILVMLDDKTQHKITLDKLNRVTNQRMGKYYDVLNLAASQRSSGREENQMSFAGALMWLLDISNYFSDFKGKWHVAYSSAEFKNLINKIIIKVGSYLSGRGINALSWNFCFT